MRNNRKMYNFIAKELGNMVIAMILFFGIGLIFWGAYLIFKNLPLF